jgi:L-methionine (R)-S-oxide reductase
MNDKMKLISRGLDASGLRNHGVSPAAVETALADLLNAVSGTEDEVDESTLYRYPVPMLSEDGSCSIIEELSPTPYDLAPILGGMSLDTTRKLRLLNHLVERAAAVTGSDWLGIYQRRVNGHGQEVLVKLAYRGRASRAEFPLTEEFARGSTNSTVGLTGEAKVIDDVVAYTSAGGGFYVCDTAVQSEACLPILSPSGDRVIGILDAEAEPKSFFTPARLAVLAAACLMAPSLLP